MSNFLEKFQTVRKHLYFRYLYSRHKFLQFVGLKDKKNTIIKMWYDLKTFDSYIFVDDRSGLYSLPIGRMSQDNELHNSRWLACMVQMYLCGLTKWKKQVTIYSLHDIKVESKEDLQNNLEPIRDPEIGEKIYFEDSIDYKDGLVTIENFAIDEDGKTYIFLEEEEPYERAYEWRNLLGRQEEYKKRYLVQLAKNE